MAIERSGGLTVSIEVIFVPIMIPATAQDPTQPFNLPDILRRGKQGPDELLHDAKLFGCLSPTVSERRLLCPNSPIPCNAFAEGPAKDREPKANRTGGNRCARQATRNRFKRSFDLKLKGGRPAALDGAEKRCPAYGIASLCLLRKKPQRLRPPFIQVDGRRIDADRSVVAIDCRRTRTCIATSASLEPNRESRLLVGKYRLDPDPVGNLLGEFVFIHGATVDNDAAQTRHLIG